MSSFCLLVAATLASQVCAIAQPDVPNAVWLAIERQLSGPAGDDFAT